MSNQNNGNGGVTDNSAASGMNYGVMGNGSPQGARTNAGNKDMRLWQKGGDLRPRGRNAPKLKPVESSKSSLKQEEAHQL